MAAQPTLPMPRLSHSELRAFSKTLLDLYSPGPLADLPARVFAAGARHISREHSAYHEFFDQNAARIVHNPEIRAETSVFNHYADQHPALARIIKDQIQCAVKISDFNTQAQWHETSEELDANSLQTLGLTKREAEGVGYQGRVYTTHNTKVYRKCPVRR